jgi:hypothetical protein
MRRLRTLACAGRLERLRGELRRLGVRYVTLHRSLPGCVPPLSRRGFSPSRIVLLQVE